MFTGDRPKGTLPKRSPGTFVGQSSAFASATNRFTTGSNKGDDTTPGPGQYIARKNNTMQRKAPSKQNPTFGKVIYISNNTIG